MAQNKAAFKLTEIKDAHLSSITCLDWSSSLPNRILSGSEVYKLSMHVHAQWKNEKLTG